MPESMRRKTVASIESTPRVSSEKALKSKRIINLEGRADHGSTTTLPFSPIKSLPEPSIRHGIRTRSSRQPIESTPMEKSAKRKRKIELDEDKGPETKKVKKTRLTELIHEMEVRNDMTWEESQFIGRGKLRRDKRLSYAILNNGRRKYRKVTTIPPHFILPGFSGPNPTDYFA